MNRAVRGVRAFGLFWWDFIVGDDWRIAAGVIVALGLTAALARTSVPTWWLMPVAVALLLGTSLWRSVRSSDNS
ncbi:MAG: hypothetical protein QOE97_2214 [Pseudonocardiales bacterium]|jgi:phosphate/sulfate permease|nr:hypothetical protein [Pseudonocardiales bacterium]